MLLLFFSFFFLSFLLFCCSSTFKDAERASLRDSGHGDSDQADSDQDTNKGSHCDTSAREALKMKAVAVNGQTFEKGEWTSSRCLTDSCSRHCLYLNALRISPQVAVFLSGGLPASGKNQCRHFYRQRY